MSQTHSHEKQAEELGATPNFPTSLHDTFCELARWSGASS